MERKAKYVGKVFLVEQVAERMNIPKTEAEKFVNTLYDVQEDALLNPEIDGIQIIGLYTVKKKVKAERVCTHPKTLEKFVKPSSIGIKATIGKQLSDKLNK